MYTDSEGKFRFTHVPPGRRWLVRLIQTGRNSRLWSHYLPVTVEPGRVTKLTAGGTGRPVIGKIQPDDAKRRIDWRGETYSLHSIGPKAPSFRTPDEYRAWYDSPEAKAALENQRHYAVVFADDGTFRADDIPAGKYEVSLYFYEPRPDENRFDNRVGVGSVRQEFEIPEVGTGQHDEPFDLGTVPLRTTRVATR